MRTDAIWDRLSQQLSCLVFVLICKHDPTTVEISGLFRCSVFSSTFNLSIKTFTLHPEGKKKTKTFPSSPSEQLTHLLFPQYVCFSSVWWATISLGHYLFPRSLMQSPCSITAMCLHVSFLPLCWPRWMGNANSQWIRVRDVGRRGAGIYHLCWWLEPKQLRALDERSEISIVQRR